MLFQSTHEDRHGAEAPAGPGEWIAKSPLHLYLYLYLYLYLLGEWIAKPPLLQDVH